MSVKERLDGNEVSWIDEQENCDVYTTNFGTVHVNRETGDVEYAVMGFGRHSRDNSFGVKIIDHEFQVYKDCRGKISEELCSPNFPYKSFSANEFQISEILECLMKDNNYSIAAVAVKKELIRQMKLKVHFSKTGIQLLKELFKIWRKPIITERTPILNRIPILGKNKTKEIEL